LVVSVQAQVLNVLRGILATQGLSMLFISHNLAVVRYISDDLAVMRDGVIVEAGRVDEVLAAPPPPIHSRTPGRHPAPPRPHYRNHANRRNDANRGDFPNPRAITKVTPQAGKRTVAGT
jgi:peptide/nickel transport system ATP-binding protein